ncbi:MAG TPA: hypothetical protein EYQ80_06440, partial [Candidatus Poseidoniales archaeon]|nr:hypothetical protein [Candidatus Poseidoniales archaeon]
MAEELMKEYQRKFGDSYVASKSGERRIPIVRMILVFSVLPALAFTAVAAIENSFTLDNEGILIDDQGEHHGLIEWNGRLYVIGETNASALDLGVEHFENETDHPFDLLMLEERFENELDRCPKEEIEMSCEITNNGLLEDPIFLGYFPASAFTVLTAGPLIKGMHAVRRRLPHLVTIGGDEGGRSQLSQEDFMEVDRFYSCMLLSLLPWRKVAQSNELSPENLVRFNRLRRVPIVLSFLGFLFLLLGTKQHWTANQTYGFDIWASSHFLLGFFSFFRLISFYFGPAHRRHRLRSRAALRLLHL